MRRNAIFGALLIVGVAVVLGATVFRTDIAQATGLAQDVTINNTSANPVPVRQQGTADVNVTNTVPIQQQGTAAVRSTNEEVAVARSVSDDDSAICGGTLYTVPNGKQLVVEYISASLFASGDPERGHAGIGTVNPLRRLMFLPMQRSDSNNWTGSESVHLAYPAGSELSVSAELHPGSSCQAEFTLGGYLQPTP